MVHGNMMLPAFIVSLMGAVTGCGIVEVERTLFPRQPTGPDGQLLFFEDLTDITEDATLTPNAMNDELRALGIESANFINAVVEDGLSTDTPPPTTDGGTTNDGTTDGADGGTNTNGG